MNISRIFSRQRVVKQVLFVVGLCFILMMNPFSFTRSEGGVPQGIVQNMPISKTVDSSLSVVGVFEAGDFIPVSAPFDAVLKEKSFAFDSRVSMGQVMLLLDTTELQGRVNEAHLAMLKALKTLQELQSWKEGAEFSRAQRGWLLAQQQVQQGERKVREAEHLLSKGIISRDEYEGLRDQLAGYTTATCGSC